MKKMAKQLQAAVIRTLHERSVPQDQQKDYLKWLLFYLDFCLKYHHGPARRGQTPTMLANTSAGQ